MIAVPECINKRPKEFNFTVSSSFPFESVPQPFEQVPSFWLQPEKKQPYFIQTSFLIFSTAEDSLQSIIN